MISVGPYTCLLLSVNVYRYRMMLTSIPMNSAALNCRQCTNSTFLFVLKLLALCYYLLVYLESLSDFSFFLNVSKC